VRYRLFGCGVWRYYLVSRFLWRPIFLCSPQFHLSFIKTQTMINPPCPAPQPLLATNKSPIPPLLANAIPPTSTNKFRIIQTAKVLSNLQLLSKHAESFSSQRKLELQLSSVQELTTLLTTSKDIKPSSFDISSWNHTFDEKFSQSSSKKQSQSAALDSTLGPYVNQSAADLINDALPMIIENVDFTSRDNRLTMLLCNLCVLTITNNVGGDNGRSERTAKHAENLALNGLPRRGLVAMKSKLRDVKWQLTLLRYLHTLISHCGDNPFVEPGMDDYGATIKSHLVNCGVVEQVLLTIQR